MTEQEFEQIGREWLSADASRRAELELEHPWLKAAVGSNWGKLPERRKIIKMLDDIDTMIVDMEQHHYIHMKYREMVNFLLTVLARYDN